MFVTAPTGISFAYIVSIKRQAILFHASVMAIWSWLATNNYQETLMNKDQVKGKVEEIKGKVKEAAGVILDDKGMEVEGNVQKNVGKAQSGFGNLKEDVKKGIDDI
jgi:uncharacterized protein YjbJ (UPF0337 family)